MEHLPALAEGSGATLAWFKRRVGVDLSLVGRLGGHSHARTHRPASGMAGSVLVAATQKACEEYAASGAFTLKKRARATEIVVGADGATRGVRWSPVAKAGGRGVENSTRASPMGSDKNEGPVLHAAVAPAVVLATGGFAGDAAGADSLLRAHAPLAASFATTNAAGTTGDGHKMALSLGAAAVDMANVQIHPTGFVDPKDPGARVKTLAAEILRGAGGLLLTRDGRRFADELGTRDYISGRMLAEARAEAAAGGERMHEGQSLEFALLLNANAAAEAEKHVALYVDKGLLTRVEGVARVAAWLKREMGGARVANPAARAHRGKRTVEAALRDTLRAYDAAAAKTERCPLTNKTAFAGAPFLSERRRSRGVDAMSGDASEQDAFYVGRVTPVTHYTMGGVRVDGDGRVVRNEARAAKTGQKTVPGLFAVGELVGGVHGANRLGGNALTECAVFGRRAGMAVPLPPRGGDGEEDAREVKEDVKEEVKEDEDAPPAAAATVTRAELARHTSEDDCWVALYGEVYDFTDFLEDHPAGAEAITRFAGTDGTRGFDAVHSPGMLEEFEALGSLVD